MNKSTPRERTVIVGASLAGARAAATLRSGGYAGALTLIGDEPHYPPFDRPSFSKEVLTGERDLDRCRIAVATFDAEFVLGRVAIALDTSAHLILLDDASQIGYDRLIVATGTVPRLLPVGESVQGIFALRTVEDALSLRAEIRAGTRVVIIGAGFIGCEVAASCRKMGADVTVVEELGRPLRNVLGRRAGDTITALHVTNGIKFVFDRKVVGITERADSDAYNSRVCEAVLDDGTKIAADVLVGAIGVVPSTEWLLGSGLDVEDGVLCNEYCEAEDAENIYAIGDVCRWFNPLYQQYARVEHWFNAASQARYIAQRICKPDPGTPYAFVPYFWSRQYDSTFQSIGVATVDERPVTDSEGKIEAYEYYRKDDLVGAFLISAPHRLNNYRRDIQKLATQMHPIGGRGDAS